MNTERAINDEIDNYNDSLFAMIGFMNFYRYDDATKKIRNEVLVFQGRRFTPSNPKNANGETVEYVTPDLGILLFTNDGVLAEVKRSFPKDQRHWMDDFQQLMAYDDDLTGWPTTTRKVPGHDVVLLLHQTRAVAVKEFYEKNLGASINFTRPFSIVEFNRNSEAQAFFFFRTVIGTLSERSLADRLKFGVSVPMTIYLGQYSTVKLYDCAPPMAYLLELIWTHVVAFHVSNTPGYKMPAKNQKVKVEVAVDEISARLETNFSFHGLQQNHADGRQPKVLEKSWVKEACVALVKFGDATWKDDSKTKLVVNFVKRENVLEYFVKLCAQESNEDEQMDLFRKREVDKR